MTKRTAAMGAAAAGAVVAFALAAAYLIPLPARLHTPNSRVIEYRDGTPAHVFLAPDDKWRIRVRPDQVDPAYVKALIALEDKRYFQHPGVDPLAVVRAAWTNLTSGRRISGASTLTMQLVRVLEPRPRTLTSKVIEALRAVQLELRLSKDEILTAYLQFTPFGRNLEGVEAASIAYFGHRATALAPAEIATLLSVPQNPNARYPTKGNTGRLRRARDEIADRLLERGALPLGKTPTTPEAILAEVKSTHPPTALRPFPREAPHAAIWIAQQTPDEERIRTTLDKGLQRLAEDAVSRALGELRAQGIHNGAVVMVNRASAEVEALVGNLDFWDGRHGGQIVSFAEPRSPGSALKPLIYALAIDRGFAGPDQLVADIPTQYGTWAPRNFDGDFNGLVRLEDALSRSLNLPFVGLLQQVGVEPFLGALRAQGVTSLAPEPGHYGLSAAIGGLEMTPLELSQVYLTLANDGRFLPLRWLDDGDAPKTAPRPLYAPGAAFLTRRALAQKERPDFPSRRRLTGAPPSIHWKTGTSFGHRDAWAAGSGPAHTAVVWLGNLDNTPSVHLLGAEAAGPILFDLLEGVSDRTRPDEPEVPTPDLTEVEVCAYSGHLATDACPAHRLTWAVRTAVPTARCPFHRKIDVDVKTGLALTPTCRAGREWETRTFLSWPSGVRRFLADRQRDLPEAPPLAPGCDPSTQQAAPEIVSPAPGQVKLLLRGVPLEQQEVPLEAELHGQATLSWFVDGKFIGSASADERLWWTPAEGTHEILVATETGASAKRLLEVRVR